METLLWVVGILVAVGIFVWRSTTPEAMAKHHAALEAKATGDAQIVCPHCAVKGQVVTSEVRRKKGISGGKATGAVLTGGVSLLATGLARKEPARHMRCGNCRMEWVVA